MLAMIAESRAPAKIAFASVDFGTGAPITSRVLEGSPDLLFGRPNPAFWPSESCVFDVRILRVRSAEFTCSARDSYVFGGRGSGGGILAMRALT